MMYTCFYMMYYMFLVGIFYDVEQWACSYDVGLYMFLYDVYMFLYDVYMFLYDVYMFLYDVYMFL